MARIVFVLGGSQSKTLVQTLVEMDFVLIDMAEVRRKYTGSYKSEQTDRLICKIFADKLRRIRARASVVVYSYPRTEKQIHSLSKSNLFTNGYKPLFVVSSKTPRHLREALLKEFPAEVTNKKITVPT